MTIDFSTVPHLKEELEYHRTQSKLEVSMSHLPNHNI